jgi:signal peptidase I
LKDLSPDSKATDMTGPLSPSKVEMTGLFRDILADGLSLRVKVTGRSMAPFLRGGEVVTIEKVPREDLRVGDLIFVDGKTGMPLLHRLVRKKRTGVDKYVFQTRGDAVKTLDRPVGHDEVLGRVCRIESFYPVSGFHTMDMNSPFQRGMNYLRASIGLFLSFCNPAGLRLLGQKVLAEFL